MSNYKTIHIDTASPKSPDSSILLIYTGGTLGMVQNEQGTLVPFDFESMLEYIPSLRTFDLKMTVMAFKEPIDSSNINPSYWAIIGNIISHNYERYDGFVILHGTDTMSYTASALSFMLKGLSKPVILTGAQLPVSAPRTDARENIITSLEIASAKASNGKPIIKEVCVCFDSLLLRGNRTRKVESQHFDAFESENCPPLAEAGITIDYNLPVINQYQPGERLTYYQECSSDVVILKLFPGIGQHQISAILRISDLKGVVLETYGSGNAPTEPWFIDELQQAIGRGVIVVNISQCTGGKVMQGKYATSSHLNRIGVVNGGDMTTEAAVTKLMILLETEDGETKKIVELIKRPLAAEMS